MRIPTTATACWDESSKRSPGPATNNTSGTRCSRPVGDSLDAVGHDPVADRREPDEVRYYDPEQGPSVFAADLGQLVSRPYGTFYLEAMDAHGGWLASAMDLARFAAAFDSDPDKCPILSRAGIDVMYARPSVKAGSGVEEKSNRSTIPWAG